MLSQIENALKKIILPDELAESIRKDVEENINVENDLLTKRINELRRQYDKAQSKIKEAHNLLLERKIEPEIHKEMVDELKSEQFGVEQELNNCTKADEKFAIAINAILSLGNGAYGIFKSSKVDVKREIINIVLSNLKLNDGNLSYALNSPFNTLEDFRRFNEWRE